MQNDVTPHALARETHQWPQEVSFDFFNTIDPEQKSPPGSPFLGRLTVATL